MIISMTGYGSAQAETDGYLLAAEGKSLNSRGLEMTTRLPRAFADRDLEIRTLLTRTLQRGKVSLTLELTVPPVATDAAAPVPRLLDVVRLRAAYDEILAAAAVLGAPAPADPLALALALPGVVRRADAAPEIAPESAADQAQATATLWEAVALPLIQAALARLDDHRRQEGAALATELRGYGARIRQLLVDVATHDPRRIAQVRARLKGLLAELSTPETLDQNRLEQELLYHLDKLDIEEEKVRLTGHLDYYDQLLNDPEPAGKKLGFLAQEIGREINTIGSKANDVAIQHLVVSMKEELEKIKEQVNNVL